MPRPPPNGVKKSVRQGKYAKTHPHLYFVAGADAEVVFLSPLVIEVHVDAVVEVDAALATVARHAQVSQGYLENLAVGVEKVGLAVKKLEEGLAVVAPLPPPKTREGYVHSLRFGVIGCRLQRNKAPQTTEVRVQGRAPLCFCWDTKIGSTRTNRLERPRLSAVAADQLSNSF